MEEKELKQEEVQENTPEEGIEQEEQVEANEVEQGVEQENVVEQNQTVLVPEKIKRDWSKSTLGAKSRDIGLITFFGSTLFRSFSSYFATSLEAQKMFLSIYTYVPGIIALLGLVAGIVAIIKTKAKWDSAIGILLNLFLIVSSVLIYVQIKQAGY